MKPPGAQEWGVARRAGAVARNGTKLLGVGFFASLFGVTITNLLVKVPTPGHAAVAYFAVAHCRCCIASCKVQAMQVSS